MSSLLGESATARWHRPAVVARLEDPLREDLLNIARPSRLEIGCSARPQAHREVIADVTETMTVDEISIRAQDLQEHLTHRGWHRAPGSVDLLPAATAIEDDDHQQGLLDAVKTGKDFVIVGFLAGLVLQIVGICNDTTPLRLIGAAPPLAASAPGLAVEFRRESRPRHLMRRFCRCCRRR